VLVTDHARKDGQDALDALRARTGVDLPLDDFLASPHIFIGSLDGLAAKFQEQRDALGISSIMVGGLGPLDRIVERLAGT
jgi:hypothetical protein